MLSQKYTPKYTPSSHRLWAGRKGCLVVEADVDLHTVKQLMAHSTLAMTERYSHVGQNGLARSVAVISECKLGAHPEGWRGRGAPFR